MGKFLLWVLLGVMQFQAQAFAVYKGHAVTQKNLKFAQTTVQIIAYSHRPAAHTEACTGTLISEQIILTAAHCFVDSAYANYDPNTLGSIVSLLDIDGQKLESIQSENIILFPDAGKEQIAMSATEDANYLKMLHASSYKEYFELSLNYRKRLSTHDIAVIILPKPFTQPHRITKIFNGELKPGDIVTFAGYGDMDYNQEQETDFDQLNKPLQLTEMTIAELQNPGVLVVGKDDSRCMVGDSGGPAFIQRGDDIYVAMTAATTFLQILESSWQEMKNDSSYETEFKASRDASGVATMVNLSQFTDFFKQVGYHE